MRTFSGFDPKFKMNFNIFLVIKFYHVVILKLSILMSSNAQQLFMSETDYETLDCCSFVFDKSHKTHTIVLDTLQTISSNNWTLNKCLHSLTDDNGKIIFTGDYVLDTTTKTKLKDFLLNRPNIVIFTRSLSNTIFFNTIANFILQSHWSLTNIVVVDNETFACKNGYFGQEVNTTIHTFLNKMWKRYEIARVVIEYPVTCPNRFSTYDGNKRPSQKVGQLYERTVITINGKDLYKTLKKSNKTLADGYPLKANIFYRSPTSINQCNDLRFFMVYNNNLTNGFCGLDALVMQDIMQVFKFKVNFKMTEYQSNYGYVEAGQATGTLGLVIRGDIDISFNSRFMVSYLDNRFEFLHYIGRDSLCAIMREPSAIPLWHYPFNVMNPVMMICTLLGLSFLGLMMYARSRIIIKPRGYPLKLYVYVINAVWAGLLGFFLNKRIQRSLLAATCLLSSIVATARYQGHINYMFATLVRYDRLRSLQEMCEQDVQVYTAPSIAVLLKTDYNVGIANPKNKLIQHLKYYPVSVSTTDYALSHPNTATLERTDKLLMTLINLVDENGQPLLYFVDECFQDYYLSYIVRTGFLFTNELKVLIMNIVEAGLPKVYNKWTRYMFTVMDPDLKRVSEPRSSIKISMCEQRIPFLLLLVGYAVSVAVFGVELCWSTRTRRAKDVEQLQKYLE